MLSWSQFCQFKSWLFLEFYTNQLYEAKFHLRDGIHLKNDMVNHKTVLQQGKPFGSTRINNVNQHKPCSVFSKVWKSIPKRLQNCLACHAAFLKPCLTGKVQCVIERVMKSKSIFLKRSSFSSNFCLVILGSFILQQKFKTGYILANIKTFSLGLQW